MIIGLEKDCAWIKSSLLVPYILLLSFFSLNCTGIALRLVLRFVSYFHSLVSVHSLKLCLDLGLMSSRPTMMPSQCSPSSIFPGGFVHELHGDCCKIEDCIEIVVIA